MNKRAALLITLCLLIFVCACKKQNSSASHSTESSSNASTSVSQVKKKGSVKKIAVPVMQDFYSITSIGSIDIVFTQGDKPSIDVEGDSTLLPFLKTGIDSGVLSISLENQANPNISHYEGRYDITAYITCPNLYIVALCRSGCFKSVGKWETEENVNFAAYSTGSFDVENLKCKTFRMESRGEDKSTFGMITSDLVYFFFRGPAQYKVGVNTPALAADLAPGTVLEVSGHADHLSIAGTEKGSFVNNLK